MKPSDFQKTVQCRFESCLKKVVRHVVKDYDIVNIGLHFFLKNVRPYAASCSEA